MIAGRPRPLRNPLLLWRDGRTGIPSEPTSPKDHRVAAESTPTRGRNAVENRASGCRSEHGDMLTRCLGEGNASARRPVLSVVLLTPRLACTAGTPPRADVSPPTSKTRLYPSPPLSFSFDVSSSRRQHLGRCGDYPRPTSRTKVNRKRVPSLELQIALPPQTQRTAQPFQFRKSDRPHFRIAQTKIAESEEPVIGLRIHLRQQQIGRARRIRIPSEQARGRRQRYDRCRAASHGSPW